MVGRKKIIIHFIIATKRTKYGWKKVELNNIIVSVTGERIVANEKRAISEQKA